MASFARKTRRGNRTKMNMKYLTFEGPELRPDRRKQELWAWAVAGLILLGCVLLVSAALSGCTHPTALERRLYTVEANPLPVSVTALPGSNGVEYQTNYGLAYSLAPSPAVQSALALEGYFGPT